MQSFLTPVCLPNMTNTVSFGKDEFLERSKALFNSVQFSVMCFLTQIMLMFVRFRQEYTFPVFKACEQLLDMQREARGITQPRSSVTTCLRLVCR